jgi:hypothetical protein
MQGIRLHDLAPSTGIPTARSEGRLGKEEKKQKWERMSI